MYHFGNDLNNQLKQLQSESIMQFLFYCILFYLFKFKSKYLWNKVIYKLVSWKRIESSKQHFEIKLAILLAVEILHLKLVLERGKTNWNVSYVTPYNIYNTKGVALWHCAVNSVSSYLINQGPPTIYRKHYNAR